MIWLKTENSYTEGHKQSTSLQNDAGDLNLISGKLVSEVTNLM